MDVHNQRYLNSLAPGRSVCDSKNAIFNLVLLIGIFRSPHDNALRWMPQDFTDEKSTLVQVIGLVPSGNKPLPVDSVPFLVPCRLMASLGHIELILFTKLILWLFGNFPKYFLSSTVWRITKSSEDILETSAPVIPGLSAVIGWLLGIILTLAWI